MSNKTQRSVCTTGEVAELCQVSIQTVIRWCKEGLLPSYTLPPQNKHRRIRMKDIEAFCLKYNIPLGDGPRLKVFTGDR